MGNITSASDITRLAQDVQTTAALQNMTEEQKRAYFNSQKQQLLNSILTDRDSTFQKTYTDAQKNNAVQNSLFFYQQRNRDLDDVGSFLKDKNEENIRIAKANNDLATRQFEINEWAYNNKLDTLFVFQLVFVSVCLTAGLAYLNRIGVLPMSVFGILIAIIIIVDIGVFMNRLIYTRKVRDQRYWNRRQFVERNKDIEDSGSGQCPPGFEPTGNQAPAPPSGSTVPLG